MNSSIVVNWGTVQKLLIAEQSNTSNRKLVNSPIVVDWGTVQKLYNGEQSKNRKLVNSQTVVKGLKIGKIFRFQVDIISFLLF